MWNRDGEKATRDPSNRRFSISEWNGAPLEQVTDEAYDAATIPSTTAAQHQLLANLSHDSTEVSSFSADADVDAGNGIKSPMMNMNSIYDAIENNKCNQQDDGSQNNDDTRARVSSPHHPIRRQSSTGRHHIPSKILRRPSVSNSTSMTVAPSSSASRTSYSSSAGTNIWTKLMGGSNQLWDGLNGKGGGDAYDDADDAFMDDDDDHLQDHDEGIKGRAHSCTAAMKRCGLSWWYETRHFVATTLKHPHILLISIATFGILCGAGMAAINSEKNRYIAKQKVTATFVASETGQWFANEFRRAMMPLYSIQQGVIHSGYFDGLTDEIGRYPNLIVEDTVGTEMEMRSEYLLWGIGDGIVGMLGGDSLDRFLTNTFPPNTLNFASQTLAVSVIHLISNKSGEILLSQSTRTTI